MNINRIKTIVDKEWAEIFKNRVVLFTVILMPLIFTALPLGMLFFFGADPNMAGGDSADVPAQFALTCGNLAPMDCMQVFLINEFLTLYMVMPVAIPITIAAYGIVGEKATHSLEPLLATPITTEELLTGKALAAVIPAVIATCGCFFLFVLVSPLTGISKAVQLAILSPTWLLSILLIGPLMAVMAVNFAMLVSSRTSDPRVAEQVSSVLVLPVILLLFGSISGFLILDVRTVLIGAAILLAIDIGLIALGAKLFQRENILTRWK